MANFEPVTTEVTKGTFTIFPGLCKGCGLCMFKCPKQALSWSKALGVYGTPMVEADQDICTACGICALTCPDAALAIEKGKKADA